MTLAFTGGRTLQILNAKEEDAGRYTCVATNEAGESLKHYEVKVYGKIAVFFINAESFIMRQEIDTVYSFSYGKSQF